ncbi:hypothetical protein B0H17DRAFT_1040648, partial [Mycena rosella]
MLVIARPCFLAIAIRVFSAVHKLHSLPWGSYGRNFGKAVESIGIVAPYRGGAYALQMSSIINQRAHFERAMRHSYGG